MNQKKAKVLKRHAGQSLAKFERENPGKFARTYTGFPKNLVWSNDKQLWEIHNNHVHRFVRFGVRKGRISNMVGKPAHRRNHHLLHKSAKKREIIGDYLTEPKNG